MPVISARAETLADAIAAAYRTNPEIGIARYDLRALDEDYVQANAQLRPDVRVEVVGSYDRSIAGQQTLSSNPFAGRITDRDSNTARLIVDQPLMTGGRAAADINATAAGIRAGREQLRAAEGDLLLDVITAYVDIRRDVEILRIRTSFYAALVRQLDEIGARREAGELTLTDVSQGQTQLQIARVQIDQAEEQLQASRAAFARAVGINAGTLEPPPPLPQLPGSIDGAFDRAALLNPELRGASFAEERSREQIAAARAAGRPTVSLRGTAGVTGPALNDYSYRDRDRSVAGELVLTQPIFQGGRTRSAIRQAQDRNGSDRLRIEATRRQMVQQVAGAWNASVRSRRNLATTELQIQSAARAFDGMFEEYRAGLRSTFDVLYAEQTLRDAEISRLALIHDLYVAEASLLRQIGLLEARNVTQGVGLYDAGVHLRLVEHKGSLPWDRVIAEIDRFQRPKPRQKPLVGAPASNSPRIAASVVSSPIDRMVADSPVTPIPGTTVQAEQRP